jgi:hypothetical protein
MLLPATEPETAHLRCIKRRNLNGQGEQLPIGEKNPANMRLRFARRAFSAGRNALGKFNSASNFVSEKWI